MALIQNKIKLNKQSPLYFDWDSINILNGERYLGIMLLLAPLKLGYNMNVFYTKIKLVTKKKYHEVTRLLMHHNIIRKNIDNQYYNHMASKHTVKIAYIDILWSFKLSQNVRLYYVYLCALIGPENDEYFIPEHFIDERYIKPLEEAELVEPTLGGYILNKEWTLLETSNK
jgi:hypothetical protein